MSKRSKRKNNLKESIILLILLLLLLVSSTYAWFTANQNVTISTIDVTIEASNGLQISTDASSWKAILSNTDITDNAYSGNTNNLPESMVPVSTVGTIDSNGYMEMYKGVVAANETSGNYELTATKAAEQEANFIAFDVFLKVDSATNLQLTDASYVKASAESSDKGIKQASRVAFVIQGNGAAGTSASTLTGLKATADSPLYIWEPNSNLHTSAAVAHAIDTYGITTTADGNADAIEYYGIKNEITNGVELSKTAGTDTTNFAKVTPAYVTEADDEGNITAAQNIFSLSAGITKVRVYMWIEGQDVDCENTASGTDIAFNVQFAVVK
jgi:predicted ribosomally synthesized peptide with SipW-like signal peptide